MNRIVILAALCAAMIFGPAAGASAQTGPVAADDQYCTPAEAQYGECGDDVTIIVEPPGTSPDEPADGDVLIPDAPGATGDAASGSAPGTASASSRSGGAAPVPGGESRKAAVSELPDTGGPGLPALGAISIFVAGAVLLVRVRPG